LSHEAEKQSAEAATERIGNFNLTVRQAKPSPDSRTNRAEALAAWLLAEWRRETAEETA